MEISGVYKRHGKVSVRVERVVDEVAHLYAGSQFLNELSNVFGSYELVAQTPEDADVRLHVAQLVLGRRGLQKGGEHATVGDLMINGSFKLL